MDKIKAGGGVEAREGGGDGWGGRGALRGKCRHL